MRYQTVMKSGAISMSVSKLIDFSNALLIKIY